MSITIDSENLKQIRKPFEVYCGIDLENKLASNLITYGSQDVNMEDVNASTAIKTSSWPAVPIADLAGGGFPLDDGVQFPVQNHAAGLSGKYGVRSYIGGGLTINVTTSASSISITCEGSGTVTVNGVTYPIQEQFVIPVRSGVEETLVFSNSDAGGRIIVYTIVPGVVLRFDNRTIISAVLDLAGNLDLKEPSFEVSTIELNAYYPFDISGIMSEVPENTPLWYYSGYPGDYCETRHFYLDGEAKMKDNVITIKGADASSKLEGVTMRSKLVRNAYQLYQGVFHAAFVRANIDLVDYQDMPSDSSTTYAAIVTEQSAQDLLGDMMVSCHAAPLYFWPTYVDAGIPRLYYKQVSEDGTTRSPYQLRVWEIREEDCTDVERVVSRKISSIASADHDTPFLVLVTPVNTSVTVGSKTVVAGEIVEFTYNDGYLWSLVRTNTDGSVIYADQQGQKWIANSNGTASLTGKVLSLSKISDIDTPTPAQNGERLYMNPVILGYMVEPYAGSIPTNMQRFKASNVTGSFTFKGDPRMQPRDTFKFIRLDGSEEIATIERIELTHEAGGTTAELHYRLGVV